MMWWFVCGCIVLYKQALTEIYFERESSDMLTLFFFLYSPLHQPSALSRPRSPTSTR